MGYVCDSNVDCEDGYDENPELCAAGALPLLSARVYRDVINVCTFTISEFVISSTFTM